MLPKALRHTLGVDQGGMIVAETAEKGILLRPSVTFPIEIYTNERIAEFDAGDKEIGRCLKRKRK